MMKKLEKILMPLAEAIGRNKYLMSIRDGFLVSTPLLIGGSIFLLIANFPIQGWINFLETTVVNSSTGQTLASFISKPAGATFDIMAIFAVIGIAYSFAGKMNTNKIFGAAVAVVSWFLIMPYSISGSVLSELCVLFYQSIFIHMWNVKVGQLKCQQVFHLQLKNHLLR